MPAQLGKADPTDPPPIDVAAALQDAKVAHREGRLEHAERGYRSILKAQGDHPDALHLLGLVAYQRGEGKKAVSLIEQAIAAAPNNADFHFNLGKVHKLQGHPDLAIPCYERAHRLAPENPGTLLNLGNCWRLRGDMRRAERCYRMVLSLDNKHLAALNNMGTLCRGEGRFDEAETFYRRALEVDQTSPAVWENLAKTLTDVERLPEAAEAYRRTLKLDSSRETATHMLAAIEGRTTTTAPEAYVRQLFDDYAARFEQHLVGELGYSIPTLMRSWLDGQESGGGATIERALDLGCGTGLVGGALRERIAFLQGVDLSPKMIAQARQKSVYDELIEADVVTVLKASPPASWNLILAADVLIYVGDLEKVMTEIGRCLKPGGHFLFSVESPDEDEGYRLRASGRYAHSEAYVMAQAERVGLSSSLCRPVPLRKNGPDTVSGVLIALTRD